MSRELAIGDATVRIAVASGLENTSKLLDALESGEVVFDFVEIMACPGGCVGGGGKHHAPGGQRAFFPQQPVILHPGSGARSPDVFGGVHRVGVGGVYTQGSALQKGGHFLGGQPPAVHGNAVRFALLFRAQRGGDADQYLCLLYTSPSPRDS